MKLLLLRHGKTEANERGLYYGSTDLPLTERGAAELMELKKTLCLPPAEIYVTSGLRRAVESLLILYGKKPQRTIPELNEFDFGDFEMKSHEELKDDPAYIRWISGDDNMACPNGESQNRFVKRIRRGYEALRGLKAESVVAVCHGGVIGTLMELLFPHEKDHYYAWIPDNGRGYSLEISSRRISFNRL